MGGMASAVASGMPKRRIEECAARKQARIDSSSDVIVGVNKYVPSEGKEQPTPELRVIDNTAVRAEQIEKLARLRGERDEEGARLRCGGSETCASSYDGNLLGLAIEAARARCTVGEISDARARMGGGIPLTSRSLVAPTLMSTATRRGRSRRRYPSRGRLRSSMGGGRASSSPRWGRTGTTGAPT